MWVNGCRGGRGALCGDLDSGIQLVSVQSYRFTLSLYLHSTNNQGSQERWLLYGIRGF